MVHPYLKYFHEQKAEVESRIRYDIERHRKAFAEINVINKDGNPVDDAQLHINQISHEFKFGCNAFMIDQFPDDEHNQKYRDMFPVLFNYAITPFYWSDFEVHDGSPRFGKDSPNVYRRPAPEKVIEYCNEEGIAIKGHPLFWHLFLPDWLVNDKDEAFFRIERRIREISENYRTRICDWDVVNESLSRQPHKKDNRLPRDYVNRIFKLADHYFPGNRLFINETTEYSWQAHFLWELSAFYMQIENMLMKGARIDAIGLQYHLFRTPEQLEKQADILLNPQCLFDVMDTYGKFNKPLQISEITVPAYGGTDESKQLQAEITEWLYKIWFSYPNAESIVWWNFVDGTAAYAPLGSIEGENYYCGGLLNYDMSPKPVYKVLERLINKEWHTEESLNLCNGRTKFNGYFGKYDVDIIVNGRTEKHTIDLTKQGNRVFKIKCGL